MTFTQVWPSAYADQVAYMKSLVGFSQAQDASSATVGLAQATSPTPTELAAAWQAYIGDTRPVPVGAKIQWWDTVRLVLDQVFCTTNDVGSSASTAILYPLSPKRKTLDMGVIAADVLQAAATITVSLAGASALWKNIFISAQMRFGSVAAGNGGWRTQSVANLAYAERGFIQGGVAGRTSIGNDAQFLPFIGNTPGNTDQLSNACYMLCWVPYAFNAVMDKIFMGFNATITQAAALPLIAGSRIAMVAAGGVNDISAITAVAFSAGASQPTAEVGSNYVIYGLK